MKKFKEWLGIRTLNTKAICILGLFIALTCIFSIWNLRIGTFVELSFKFVPVFIIGALFGPIYAGLTSFLGDLISVMVAPLGPPIIGLCVTEFISGFIFGAFFFKNYQKSKSYIVRVIICILLQFFLSAFINSLILFDFYGTKTLWFWFGIRFSPAFARMFLQAAMFFFAPYYLEIFSRFTK